MSEETKIYLDLSDEVKQFIAGNKIDIQSLLEAEGIDVEVDFGTMPYVEEKGERTKDIVTIIIASSALVLSIGYAISQVLSTLNKKTYLVEFYEYEELRDADGNILCDVNSDPIFKKNKKYELFEPRQGESAKEMKLSAGGKNGIVIRVNSSEK